ncbi:hypothetical protein CR194_03515 [Salipaludibacillus keqinensis]|uniref:Uncharacterized protein n=1 Tax=Salipaludibacillus keqinensis TaxID=2045207 RepID=A0A323TI91_9BACI|nr:hypothetical protein [Salipaludibacillus keqinensis]PYZ94611.1 hypothetical protein CR194_03515 [Salipaludibacillus keqinensis]
MNRKTGLIVNTFASLLLLYVIIYYGYYVYIGLLWGFSERMFMLLVSDSLFLLFVPIAIGLFLKKKWSWWLTMSVFLQLFIAKVIAILANIFLLLSGSVAEPLQGSNILIEISFLFMYFIVIIGFSSKSLRSFLSIERPFSEWFWRVFLLAMVLYTSHFIITVVAISTLNP